MADKFKVGDRVRLTTSITPWGIGTTGTIKGKGNMYAFESDEQTRGHNCNTHGTPLTVHGYWVAEEGLELIKEEQMTEIPKVYKAMRVVDGELMSIHAGRTGGFSQYVGVVYKEGAIAYTPSGQKSLSAFGMLADAIEFCKRNHHPPMVIHEATPLGEKGEALMPTSLPSSCTYPALLIGKEVWGEPAPRPEAKFKVGDKVVGVSSYAQGCSFTIAKVFWTGDIQDAYGSPNRWLYNDGDTNYGEEMLELAPEPKEVWVDVTGECTFTVRQETIDADYKGKYVLLVKHNEHIVAHWFATGLKAFDSTYKIDTKDAWVTICRQSFQ